MGTAFCVFAAGCSQHVCAPCPVFPVCAGTPSPRSRLPARSLEAAVATARSAAEAEARAALDAAEATHRAALADAKAQGDAARASEVGSLQAALDAALARLAEAEGAVKSCQAQLAETQRRHRAEVATLSTQLRLAEDSVEITKGMVAENRRLDAQEAAAALEAAAVKHRQALHEAQAAWAAERGHVRAL